MTEQEESIRAASIAVVTEIIAELQSCGHAAGLSLEHLEWCKRLLAQLERGPGTAP
jgi:hypothetical protein